MRWTLILIGVITLLVMAALAVPMPLWRSGETPQPDLQYLPSARETLKSTRVWIDARVSRYNDSAGRPVGIMGVSHDISDRTRSAA